ncbi:non-ribosomal peptide synthetase [Flavobacterium sp. N502540]|uniref:non-ribosomal peptide synthetase n=1 Tax=Flavobacterium sp. N502540 TaxID=2986838 RepID=UPI002224A928|nr:non-ribosomal peptide synthetase [Flavobacterium sp. N502540]
MKIKDIYPLTPLQEGIYFHWKLSKSMYFEQSSYKIQAELDINYLKESYDQLIARHDVLRTCFRDNVGEDLLQIVQNEVPSNFTYLDITGNTTETIAAVKEQDIAKGFDLATGSQMRLTVLKTSGNQYELIWSHHHIIMDGWCISILIGEFFALYEGLLQGKKNILPKATPYSDYVKWLMKNDKEKSLQYWNGYLEGFQGLNTLPFPKQNTETFTPGEIFYTIGGSLREKLAVFCQENSITENVFFQTIWGILLAKYNNTNDVVFGGVVSGRPAEIYDVANIIGLFINTIPVRISFDRQTTVKQILLQTQEQAIKSLPYHYQAISDTQRSVNNNQSLFDHIIVFENYMTAEVVANELADNEKTNIKLLETELYEGENYDFSLAIIPGEEISIRFTFNAEKYKEEAIIALKAHFEQVINTVVENFDIAISEVELLKESEKEAVLSLSGHDMLKEISPEYTLVELFENVVKENQDHIALVYGEAQYSFGALNVLADQFAAFLISEHKVQSGDFIALQLDRSDWLIVALLGTLKAGAVYVPLHINLPQDRVDYILEDTNSSIIINEDFIDRFREYPKANLTVSKAIISPSDLAYLIYTSGSTGKPKGVLVEHRSISALLVNTKNRFVISQKPVMPLLASNSFDIFLFELFYPLLAGGKVVMVPNEEIKDMEDLSKILRQTNSFHAVPTLMRAVIDHIKTNKSQQSYHHIESIFIGGDKIPVGILEEIREVFVNAVINVLYGPTEGSIFITSESYLPSVKQFPNAVIGQSNAYNATYVLDDHLKLCPFYSIGELCISGNQVTRGYLNKEEITAEKFIVNPFKADEKLYRTGDMVKRLANGKIEFVGRKDNQVKVRGYRIELEEIENALLSNEQVDFAVVKTITVSGDEKEIVAYLKATKPMDTQELIQFLKGILPSFMIPDYYIQLDEIPLTVNGKLDAKKLPNPLDANAIREVEYVQAVTDTEIKLTEIWQRILDRKVIGIQDNFFHLGGHSLKMIKLSNQIFVNFGMHLNIKEIYIHPTIEQQAVFIDSAKNGYTLSIPNAEIAESYPLSSSQYRMYNICSIDTQANKAYNIRIIDVKNKPVNVESFTKALNSLLERHEVLRTAFITNESGEPRQIIIPIQKIEPLKIQYLDLRNSETLEKDLQKALIETGDVSFNLETPPLMKAALISVKDDKWIIGIIFHHIIFDGWSTDVFVKELYALYEKYNEKRDIILPPLAIQFKDYAVWEQSMIKSDAIEADKNYWLKQFEGNLPILSELGDQKRPNIKTHNGGVISKVLKGNILKDLNTLCENEEVSLFMVFLAVTNILIYKNTGDQDIITGSPIVNRDYPELFDQIGFYANTIPLRTHLDENASFTETLKQIKENVINAKEYQKFPLDELIKLLNIKYDASRNPLFDIVVTAREENNEPSDAATYDTIIDVVGNGVSAKFDLTFDFLITESKLTLSLQYNTDIFSSEKITSLLNHLEQILVQVTLNGGQKISAIDCLTQAEKQHLLEEINGHQTDYPKEASIIELFEKQAALTPEKTALVYKKQRYTYQELNNVANQLANYLEENYKIKRDLAAIYLPKNEWQIISILALLKLGCAYVPISTDYPQERISYIIKDANAECLIAADLIEDFVKSQTDYSSKFESTYAKANDLAYVMYTSGSTGEPKGVLIEQQSVVRLVKNTNFINLTGEEVLLATGAFSFDASTFEYWGMLLNGGTLVICDENTLLSVRGMNEVVANEKVTIMWFTAGWLHQLVDENLILFKNLKTIVCGGDVLSPHHITKLKSTYPELVVVNGYGPTENTTFSITHTIDLPIKTSVPIGVPISNSTVYIMDKNHQLVPKGAIGEICVGGDGLARGYLNNAELTHSKFIKNPYKTAERLYKTGDLGRWTNNNTIEFIGRKDNQVKLRGYRIELGEIENILCTHQSIFSSLVVITDGTAAEKKLIAYVITDDDLESNSLKNWLRTQLPKYMIPNHFVFLQEFPLNINGKIDRAKLPEITSLETEREEYVAPDTTTEKTLVKIWEDVLEIEKIGLRDNFFDLGGHSLKAVKMFNLINNEFEVKLAISDLFNNPTVESLANEIDNVIWVNNEELEDVENENITI